jgi:hypothetical protein
MTTLQTVKYIACGIVGFSLSVLINKPELLEPTVMDFLPDATLLLALPPKNAVDKDREGDGDE